MSATAWPRVSLGDLLTLQRRPVEVLPDREYQEIGIYCHGGGIFHKNPRTGLEVGDKALFQMRSQDLILQVTFAWEGAIAVCSDAEDGLYGSSRYPTYRTDEKRCNPHYLAKYLGTHDGLAQIDRICPGSAGRNRVLALKRVPEITVPLPPLEEQNRIVAKLDALAAKIDEARNDIRLASDAINALPGSELASVVADLSRDHPSLALEELLLDACYGTSVKCSPERSAGSTPVLRIPNVASEVINLRDMKYGALSEPEIDRLSALSGDILVVRTNGSADLVGRCAVVGELPEPMCFASYMIRLRCDTARIAPAFLQTILRHLRTDGQLIDFARTTAGQYNVSLGRLRKARVPLPPMAIQDSVVHHIRRLQAGIDHLANASEQRHDELTALLPSLLDRAFRAEL